MKSTNSKFDTLSVEKKPNVFFKDVVLNSSFAYLIEVEPTYKVSSYIQKNRIEKQFNDWLKVYLSTHIEYANRDEDEINTRRWFDNTTLRSDFILNSLNRISIFGGGSISDTTFTSYGTTIQNGIEVNDLLIRNYLTGAYEYFYYWKNIGQYFVSNNFNISYDRVSASVFYRRGVIKNNFIDGFEIIGDNPNTLINLELQYKLSVKPFVNIGINYRMQDFKYYSPLYYSPQDRNLKGIFAGFYDHFGKMYVYLGGAYRVDNNSLHSWNYDSEVGYDYKDYNAAIGLSRFFDPFYRSYYIFLNLGKTF